MRRTSRSWGVFYVYNEAISDFYDMTSLAHEMNLAKILQNFISNAHKLQGKHCETCEQPNKKEFEDSAKKLTSGKRMVETYE